MHTNITNLRKEYRGHVRWNGRPLWLIDIVSSQPLILALTLREQAREEAGDLADGVRSDDAQKFLDSCLKGVFYEDLAARAGMARDQAKRKFFAVAYGQRRDMLTGSGWRSETSSRPASGASRT